MATLPNSLPSLATSGLGLPSGTLVDATDEGPWHEPLLWHADEAARPGDWGALRASARTLGLLPVLVDGGRRARWPAEWRLAPARTSYPGDHDAEEVLRGFREDNADGLTAPGAAEDTVWPGLSPAPAGGTPEDPDVLAGGIADMFTESPEGPRFRMGLVPARRSADIPAAIGWPGPLNHDSDVARLCAVLRSWEDRFDIRVLIIGFDTLIVSVGRPPTTLVQARALAAEHFAFCPDNIDQNPPYGLELYAERNLLDQSTWGFWWD
ncbi:DUF4253 domain-containing protein [Streptomyces sp. NBC_01754]|uniref:DUF4253 domain-containing protein n=1 Tax=Streptomyces sp. NBC_01754 TaxID=2975930 RepID=UPI002DDB05E1|nr:DUF4253 domain-containing protein [Streptomyces sp. NBC_01754]WSC93110.1 DUF4253 domain-containing protein [Streptomyces sp. NBC_01754]